MEAVRIFCKSDTSLSVAIRCGQVVLAPNDPNDPTQHWSRDFNSVGRLFDNERQNKAFVLMNNATQQAMAVKPSANSQVSLVPYNCDSIVDLTMVWVEGTVDLGDDFREVKSMKDTSKTLNALNGYVKDGTLVGYWSSEPDAANAVWKMTPHCGC
ncbi:hypothetical protein ACP70R_023926 [Stipagrostis hirtigluma subsp. patula]